MTFGESSDESYDCYADRQIDVNISAPGNVTCQGTRHECSDTDANAVRTYDTAAIDLTLYPRRVVSNDNYPSEGVCSHQTSNCAAND